MAILIGYPDTPQVSVEIPQGKNLAEVFGFSSLRLLSRFARWVLITK